MKMLLFFALLTFSVVDSSGELGAECTPPGAGGTLQGSCSNKNHVCYQDLSDSLGIYDTKNQSCKMLHTSKPSYICRSALIRESLNTEMGYCERIEVQRRIDAIYKKILKLSAGSICKWFENASIMQNKGNDVSYRFLVMLLQFQAQKIGLCDPNKLLTCGHAGTCECFQSARQREVQVDGQKYLSDYCYIDQGMCKNYVTKTFQLTAQEEQEIAAHYGDPIFIQPNCANGNICVFTYPQNGSCTHKNTGLTGVDVDATYISPDEGTEDINSIIAGDGISPYQITQQAPCILLHNAMRLQSLLIIAAFLWTLT